MPVTRPRTLNPCSSGCLRRTGRSRAHTLRTVSGRRSSSWPRASSACSTRGGTLVCEAGTGTGKSLGYLVPAALSGRRVVVSTATLALQSQLLRDDLPLAAAARGKPIRAELLKGRSNYACRRMVVQLGMRLFDPLHSDAIGRLRPWLDTTLTGDRAELDHVPPAGAWAEVAVGPERCLGARCAVLRDVLRRGGARARGRRRGRDRQPRALLRRSRPAHRLGRRDRRAARARRGRLRRGARARGRGGRVARRAPLAARRDAAAARLRARLPARQRDGAGAHAARARARRARALRAPARGARAHAPGARPRCATWRRARPPRCATRSAA